MNFTSFNTHFFFKCLHSLDILYIHESIQERHIAALTLNFTNCIAFQNCIVICIAGVYVNNMLLLTEINNNCTMLV